MTSAETNAVINAIGSRIAQIIADYGLSNTQMYRAWQIALEIVEDMPVFYNLSF